MVLAKEERKRGGFSSVVTNLKHLVISLLVLLVLLIIFGLAIGAEAHLFEDRLAYQLDGETHVFYEADGMVVRRLRGDNESGFSVERSVIAQDESKLLEIHFPADGSAFSVKPREDVETPPTIYTTSQPIIAISDIESGYGAFKQFLMAHGVMNERLDWTFGEGHLVLVGDFVDRGASTTQVLWAIYQLEQSAREQGGTVHFIIGNHEIKFMQGNFQAADEKYFYIAGMLGKQQSDLYGHDALIGRWMASKNVLEVINDIAFVHGGLHPEIADFGLAAEDINRIVREDYRQLYFTPQTVTTETKLRSSSTGPAWYRGYFKEDLTQEQVEQSLEAVGARAVVVGHTLQSEVSMSFDRRVIAIDVRHPKDYLTSFPFRESQGLLIDNGDYYRLLEDGTRELL
ncbi:MAG: metallophosphoesterase [Pseudomonadota bacterium]